MNTIDICNSANVLTIVYLIKSLITIISIAVPVILIVMATLDLVKAVVSDENGQKKLYAICVKRFVYAF